MDESSLRAQAADGTVLIVAGHDDDFSSADTSPEPAVVEVPRAVMEGLVGQTATVEYRDVYGDVVEASAVWLIWTP